MDLVKKNWLSILCGAVALLAIISTFWPLNNWTDKLQAEGAQRVQLNSELERLSNDRRALPVLPTAAPLPDALPGYPRPDVTQGLLDQISQVRANNDQLLRAAVARNRHQPLIGRLPTGLAEADQGLQYDFAVAYARAATDDAIMRLLLSADPDRPLTLPLALTELNDPKLTEASFRAAAKLTDDQIADIRAQRWEQIKKETVILINTPKGQEAEKTTVEDAQRKYLAEYDLIPRQEQMKHAGEISLYLEPAALKDFYQTIVVGKKEFLPKVTEVWNGQVGLFVLQDIAEGINYANQTLSDRVADRRLDVMHSAVKRIVHVDRPGYLVSGDYGDLTGAPSQPLPNVSMVSATGRVTNSLYEVLSYEMTLDVDARKIPQILHALEHGRFVTVLQVTQITVLDPAVEAQDGFIYGDQPVAEITIKCENLLLRQWEKGIMPVEKKPDAATPGGGIPGLPTAGIGGMGRTMGPPKSQNTSPFLDNTGG